MGTSRTGNWLGRPHRNVLAVMLALAAGCAAPGNRGSWVYPIDAAPPAMLRTLDAAGMLDSAGLGTLPISRVEAARLTLEAEVSGWKLGETWRGRLERLARDLEAEARRDLRAGGVEDLRFFWSHVETAFRLSNEYGRTEDPGKTYRARMRALFNLGRNVFFTFTPELVATDNLSEGDDVESFVYEANVRVFAGSWEFEYGIDSMWWGPGVHGSLLMSNNAAPFSGLRKISTHEPFLLPIAEWPTWVTLFSVILEDDREDHPRAILGGMRLETRPIPCLTLGLSRTAMFGGNDREPVDLGEVWDVFWAIDENAVGGPGNQLASVDVVYRNRWRGLPLEAYLEVGGEDESLGFIAKIAVLAGISIPVVSGRPELSLRLEWADNALEQPSSWYVHSEYTEGYTYDDVVVGHHMGHDAQDRFAALEWAGPGGLTVALFRDVERHQVSTAIVEELRETGFRVEKESDGRFAYGLEGVVQDWDNYQFVAGVKESGYRVRMWLRAAW
jgi:hypothetical protein